MKKIICQSCFGFVKATKKQARQAGWLISWVKGHGIIKALCARCAL